jgi:hypothetical protein
MDAAEEAALALGAITVLGAVFTSTAGEEGVGADLASFADDLGGVEAAGFAGEGLVGEGFFGVAVTGFVGVEPAGLLLAPFTGVLVFEGLPVLAGLLIYLQGEGGRRR